MATISVSKVWLSSVVLLSSTIPIGLLGVFGFIRHGAIFEGNLGSATSVLCILLLAFFLHYQKRLCSLPANFQRFILGATALLVVFSYVVVGSTVS